MRILYVHPFDMAHPRFGSAIVGYHPWRRMANRHDIDMIVAQSDSEFRKPADPGYESPESWCKEVIYVPNVPNPKWKLLTAFPKAMPARVMRILLPWRAQHTGLTMNPELERVILEQVSKKTYDWVHITPIRLWSRVAAHFPAPLAYTAHDVVYRFLEGYAQQQTGLEKFFAEKRAQDCKRFELEVWNRVKLIIALTELEADIIRESAPHAKIVVTPNGVDSDYLNPNHPDLQGIEGKPNVLLYVGLLSYEPNVDAVQWLATEVMPGVRAARPDAELWLVGRKPLPEVTKLGELPGVKVVGEVPDIRPYMKQAVAMLAPIRIGAGMRVKTLEAMSMAKPLIATEFALEGMEYRDGEHVLLAETAEETIEKSLWALNNPEEATALGDRARQWVMEHYSWDAMTALMEDAFLSAMETAKNR